MPQQVQSKTPTFVTNVIWSWAGTAISLFIGIFLSRIIVRTLGAERYGLWVIVTGMMEYLWFFDLGFNTAVTNFLARFRAKGDSDSINSVINTSLLYFSAVSATLITLSILGSRNVLWLFPRMPPDSREELSILILICGVSWGIFVLFHIFTSALDGFQRFDMTTKALVTTMLIRSGGAVILLKMGYGLREMGIIYMVGQLVGYLMNFFSFRRVFPELKLSLRYANIPMIKQIVRYGAPSFMVNTSTLTLGYSSTYFITRYTSAAEAGFFALPMRLLQNAVEAVSRVGLITRSAAADREASGRKDSLLSLGIFSNRYCFTLFVPLSLFLLVYGRELISLWMTPAYAERSALILPIMVPAIAFVMAGQFNSSSILFGLGTHQSYAYGLMTEAILNVIGMITVVPRFGLVGAAWVSASLMLSIRGLYTPYLVCKNLNASFPNYMAEIYLRPLLTAVPVAAAAVLLKPYIPGRSWMELIVAGSFVAGTYLGLALFTCFDPTHRERLFGWIGAKRAALGA